MLRLSDLKTGQKGYIIKVLGHGGFRRRIMEMGFVRGKCVEVLQNAPLKDPINYRLMNYEVSLRRSEAPMIMVVSEEEAAENLCQEEFRGTSEESCIERLISSHKKEINIALVGNPNSGKSSLFNALTGGHEHVGNYSGVTVDAHRGQFTYKDYTFVVYDLPGTYALSAYTPEELYVRRHLREQTPDVIVNVVVASNLERNLYLSTELIDINQSMVIALNMYDELEESGAKLDYDALGGMLGVPIVPVAARHRRGIEQLLDTVIEVYENCNDTVRHIHINCGPVVEEAIRTLSEVMKSDLRALPKQFSSRYLAIKLLEGDREVEQMLSQAPQYAQWIALRDQLAGRVEKELHEDVETAVSGEKYGFISGALKETYTPSRKDQMKLSDAIDAMITHRLWGFPIFFLIMWLTFEATFRLGAYPMEWIETGVAALGSFIGAYMAEGPLKDLLVDGVIGGVGGVIVFLPNILILFLCISLMEDSGYMARAAFIMDRVMHRIGLHGKSFIPLIMGFGCNVPAIMATRTIESRSSRLITILITPFISCSARLPVYILLIGVFFPGHASLVLIGLYALGILIAALTARLMRRAVFKKDETPFVMELPPYRLPGLRVTLRHMWEKGAQYLRKMGGVILVASIIVWALSYFPRTAPEVPLSEQQAQSYLGRIGRFIEPVMKPLGIEWRGSVALAAGVGAKEIVVSTLGVLYSENAETDETSLSAKLKEVNPETGTPDFTPLSALSFLVFVLLYVPCIAAIAAIARETGSRKWALFSLLYNTGVAWVVAFIVHSIGKLFI